MRLLIFPNEYVFSIGRLIVHMLKPSTWTLENINLVFMVYFREKYSWE